jgi:ribosomal protein L11
MPDVDMLREYWLSHPPVHLMVAGYLGVKPQSSKLRKARKPQSEQEAIAALAQISAPGVERAPMPDYLRTLVTQAEEMGKKLPN